ncbi:hypothetical protein ACFPJ1_41485 [Kribbella qitaiheensis]|uniref:hypothetical protein n=1 Tax=Kribbella qitaiheensis TaxID=1544730 RepID=UPI00361E350F
MTDPLFAEVVQHHEDLARWLGSEAEPALLDTFSAAHVPAFSLVAIDGAKLSALRRVTAVLVPDPSARYGVRWSSVHETPVL